MGASYARGPGSGVVHHAGMPILNMYDQKVNAVFCGTGVSKCERLYWRSIFDRAEAGTQVERKYT